MKSLDELKKELDETNAKIKRHHGTSISGAQMNPAGDIGGIRSRSPKRKQQIFDRYTREANEGVALYKRRDSLKREIARIETQPARDRKALLRDIALYHWWNSLKPGDTIKPGNATLTIKKKNAKSIVVETGTNWKLVEVTGISNKRLAEIKAHLQAVANG